MLTRPGNPPDPDPEYPVFVRRGDARPEVDDLLAALQTAPGEAGFLKYIYVTKADQTVVMVVSRDSPLARELRGRGGWMEPLESE